MDSSSYSNKNVSLNLPVMGKVLIQTTSYSVEEAHSCSMVIFPRKMNVEEKEAAASWATLSHKPVYCLRTDAEELAKKGVPQYRFHKIWDYHSYKTPKGVLEFLPSANSKKVLFFNFKRPADFFHVAFRPLGERGAIFISQLQFSSDEARMLRTLALPFVSARKGQSELSLSFAARQLDSEILCAEEFNKNKGIKWKETKPIVTPVTLKEEESLETAEAGYSALQG